MRVPSLGRSDPPPATAAIAAIGGAVLAVGAAVYLLARQAGSSWLPGGLGLDPWPHLSGALPALLHAQAFTLLTAAALGPTPRVLLAAAAGWVAAGSAFEALQHPELAAALWPHPEAIAPSGPSDHAVALLARHAHLGTFDPLDLVATLLGGALAVAIGLRLARRGGSA